jgi:hypothetical protein
MRAKSAQTGDFQDRFFVLRVLENQFQINMLTAMTLRCTAPIFRVTPNVNSDSFFRPFEGAADGRTGP